MVDIPGPRSLVIPAAALLIALPVTYWFVAAPPPCTARDPAGGLFVSNATVEQGGRTTIQIAAPTTVLLRIGFMPQNTSAGLIDVEPPGVSMLYQETCLHPTPDAVMESFPPQWRWAEPTPVRVSVPVTAGPNATPGTYTVIVQRHHDPATSPNTATTATATLTVTAR